MALAIECATGRIDVLVMREDGEPLARETEEVTHGHARRLTPMVRAALDRAGVAPEALRWIATDLGPGSFTGVRVGLASAEALALVSGAELLGASSLAALALRAPVRRTLVVPLVPAGRKDVYAGFFRADARGAVSLVAAPEVKPVEALFGEVAELLEALQLPAVRFIGPGAKREQAALEAAWPQSTWPEWRFEGLDAEDLARAARSGLGPRAGLPAYGARLDPLYVRSAQAEELVRHRVTAAMPLAVRDLAAADVPAVAVMEREIFSDPWPESFFLGELRQPLVYARVAERDGAVIGYLVAWLGVGTGHLGNLAVAGGQRRRGVARVLLEDLLGAARARGIESVALEVRVSNYPAQALYRAWGFRVVGLRRGYYRDTGEDALVMEWRAPRGARS